MHILLIGLGNMGSKYLRKLEELSLKPILCDIDRNKIKDSGHPFYCHYGDVSEKLGGVIVAVDPQEHVKIAKEFLDKGIPVLLEKPPSLRSEEFKSIADNPLLEISEVELYSEAVKNFPLHLEVKSIYIERLNRGRGYINPVWDLAWHDLYILQYLFRSVNLRQVREGKVWTIEGTAGEGIPFRIKLAWNYEGEVSRRWKVETLSGEEIVMDFYKEEIRYNGVVRTREWGDKLREMVIDFVQGVRREGSRERALRNLELIENIL
jgi:predicted dehydrogenase